MDEKMIKVIEKFKQKTRKQCYSITLLDEEPLITESKIGGIPYISMGETYPIDSHGDFMPLFVQINFEQINLKNFPKKGLLQLFVDKSLSYPSEYKVRYIENINNYYNKNLSAIDLSDFIVKSSIKLQLDLDETYMPMGDFRFNSIFCDVFNEVFNSNIKHFYDIDKITGFKNSFDLLYNTLKIKNGLIGGYADFTQNDPRSYDKKLSNYTECLIKIDSNLDDRIMIGDAGIAWLIISEDDLKNKRFEKASFDWDCC